jgi:hypothetical protein
MQHSFNLQALKRRLRQSVPYIYARKRRTEQINRRSFDLSAPPAWMGAYRRSQVDRDGAIRLAHAQYVSSVSSSAAAISLELAHLLWFTAHQTQPGLILDLGSGFSSYVLRRYQRDAERSGRKCRVISCDHDSHWLGKTAEYLEANQLSTADLWTLERLIDEQAMLQPDLVLHDLGYPAMRVEQLPMVMQFCRNDTLLIIDDLHKQHIQEAVTQYVQRQRLRYHDLTRYTYDSFGRYAWLIQAASCEAATPIQEA